MAIAIQAKEVPVREIEGKIQLAEQLRDQSQNILGRTAAMRSRLLGMNEISGTADSSKPTPVRAELAELEHVMVDVQNTLNTVQIHLNELERI